MTHLKAYKNAEYTLCGESVSNVEAAECIQYTDDGPIYSASGCDMCLSTSRALFYVMNSNRHPDISIQNDATYTAHQAAEILGLSMRTIRNACQKGHIEAEKVKAATQNTWLIRGYELHKLKAMIRPRNRKNQV